MKTPAKPATSAPSSAGPARTPAKATPASSALRSSKSPPHAPEAAVPKPLADTFTRLRGVKACVDVGGTKIAVSVADKSGLRGRVMEPTAKEGASDALGRQVLRLIEQACAKARVPQESIDAVGVSSCGPFVLNQGLVELAAPNICGGLAGPARGLPNDWKSAILEAPLRARYQRVHVANDALAALQAERLWGALQGYAHCAYVTWSTGVGCGVCVDGHLLRGKNGNAGHAGHMFIDDNHDALCGCGNVGDVEGQAAGNAVARRFRSLGYGDTAGVFNAAQAGDARALAIVDDLCRVMGRMLYNLIITLDLQRVSLGGSVFWHHREFLLPRLHKHIDGHLPALTAGVQLVSAGLGERLGDYAALALVC